MSVCGVRYGLYASAASVPAYNANAVDYNGSNSYLSRGSDLTGNADSKKGIISAWVRLDGGDGANLYMVAAGSSGNNLLYIRRAPTNRFQIVMSNGGATTILDLRSVAAYAAGATWYNLLASWDLSTSTTHLYVNNVSDMNASTLVDDTIRYMRINWSVGADVSGSSIFNGCMAEFYFAPGQYLDFSNSANRAKFISGGHPVNLGTDGSTPTGVAPLIYLKDPYTTVETNSGTGGNFTQNGTFAACGTTP